MFSPMLYFDKLTEKRSILACEKELCFDDDTVEDSRDMVSAGRLSSKIRSALGIPSQSNQYQNVTIGSSTFWWCTPQPS